MKKNVYKIDKKKHKDWYKYTCMSFVLFIIINTHFTYAQLNYQENTGYLIQKIEQRNSMFYIPFKHKYVLPVFYGFYIVDEKTLLKFIEENKNINTYNATMLCDPADGMYADSVITRDVKRFTRIRDILLLDDSEIYQIGSELYIIRKIHYAYYDNSQVKVYIEGSHHFLMDDISDEESITLYYASYEVGELYDRDYYQCYHHIIEILPTPTYISKYCWKRLYQLGEKNK